MPSRNFSVDPASLVEVLHEGEWFAGFLYWWRRDGDGWRAFVRYPVKPGFGYTTWVPAAHVRATSVAGLAPPSWHDRRSPLAARVPLDQFETAD